MNKNKITNLKLTVFTFLFIIFLSNAFVDFLIYQKNPSSKFFLQKPNYKKKTEIIENSNEKIYPNIGSIINNPSLSLILEKKNTIFFGDIANSKIVLCNEIGEFVYFKSDKYGFRNFDKDYNKNKSLMVGDSFGMGVCIKDEHYLKNLKLKVRNLSVAGSGPLEQIALINEYVNYFDVDNLIWLFYEGNDILDFREELKNPILKKYDDLNYSNWPNYEYFSNKGKIDEILIQYTENLLKKDINKTSHFYKIQNGKEFSLSRIFKLTATRNILRNIRDNFSYESSYVIEKYLENLKKINDLLLSKDIKVNMVFLPSYSTIKNQKIKKTTLDLKELIKIKFKNINLINFDEHLLKKNFDSTDVFITKKTHYNNNIYLELYEYINNQVF